MHVFSQDVPSIYSRIEGLGAFYHDNVVDHNQTRRCGFKQIWSFLYGNWVDAKRGRREHI